jgi:hypothetical protein
MPRSPGATRPGGVNISEEGASAWSLSSATTESRTTTSGNLAIVGVSLRSWWPRPARLLCSAGANGIDVVRDARYFRPSAASLYIGACTVRARLRWSIAEELWGLAR